MTETRGELIALLCPPGAELAPISHGATSYAAYRLHGRSGPWVVEVPRHVAFSLCRVGGFRPLDMVPGIV